MFDKYLNHFIKHFLMTVVYMWLKCYFFPVCLYVRHFVLKNKYYIDSSRKSDADFSTEIQFFRFSFSSLIESWAYSMNECIQNYRHHPWSCYVDWENKISMKPLWLNSFLNQTTESLTTFFTHIIFLNLSIESVMFCYADF